MSTSNNLIAPSVFGNRIRPNYQGISNSSKIPLIILPKDDVSALKQYTEYFDERPVEILPCDSEHFTFFFVCFKK